MKRIALLSAGGTLGAVREHGTETLIPGQDSPDLVDKVPELASIADIVPKVLFNHDSSNLQPHHWVQVAEAVHRAFTEDDVDGVVVTHGTDTMAYTAAALSLMVRHLPGPVALTGSQLPFSEVGSDGRRNLLDAFRVATEADLGEVVLVFNGKIIRGSRSKKMRALAYDAFESVGMPLVGTVEADIVLSSHARPRIAGSPVLDTRLADDVCLVKLFPGFQPSLLPIIAERHHGIVLEGFGAGNVPTDELSLVPAIEKVVGSGCHVVLTTQCVFGAAWSDVYRTGRLALESGAIPAYDMNSETAVVKLMWVLGHTTELAKVRSMMHSDYAGEITARS